MRRTYEQNIKTIVMVSQFMFLYSFWGFIIIFITQSFTIFVPPHCSIIRSPLLTWIHFAPVFKISVENYLGKKEANLVLFQYLEQAYPILT